MSEKRIPNADLEFLTMAQAFAQNLGKDPEKYFVSREECDALGASVEKYRAALVKARSGDGRSRIATQEKENSRAIAERIVRDLSNAISANKKIDPIAKIALGLKVRGKAKQLTVPQEPPRLEFVQALHMGSGATPMHELAFRSLEGKPKPPGAVRLELFVDLVPADEKLPEYPGQNLSSRPWYLRSFTRSPIVLMPPQPRVPMRVVYWGRWADSTGNVGPFSQTVVGWIEGGSHKFIRPIGSRNPNERVPVLEDISDGPREGGRERTYVVAVMEAQYQSINPHDAPPALEQGREVKQLEGPVEEAA